MEAKTKTFWFIIIAFLLGGVGGGFVGNTYFGKRSGNGKKPNRTEIRKHFTEKLQLTPEQSALADSIIEFHRSKINGISQQYSGIFKMERDSMRLEIRKLLTPEQNMLYDQFIKEIDERDKSKRQSQK